MPSPGITYQQLLDLDTHPVPDVLRLEHPAELGDEDISVERYTTHEWHRREVEGVWRRAWQFACREEHIPEVGDHVVYEIVRDSYLVIRTAPDQIKAYPNACLHRGRQLKDHAGRCSEIRCPFHGFAWGLDGTLQDVPAEWDFGHIDPAQFALPEVQVDSWAGFVFINPDPEAEPLAEFLGEMVDHFEIWDLGDRFVEAHVAKVIPANWKVTQEAFCEAYHVNATHPQIMPWVGDTNSQVDVWRNFARAITPSGTPSPLIDFEPSQDDMMRAMLDVRHDQQSPLPEVSEQQSMRAMAAAGMRDRLRPIVGDERADRTSDAELMDNLDYTVFPNFHPWGGFNRITYRFRPNGDDHRSSIMECLILSPFSGERPPPADTHWLEDHETFTDAPELGGLAKVFDQDLFNMPKVQSGLEATRKPGVTLASYQESKIRWLHQRLGDFVEGGR
ncbi:MAG: aromatic ring-hydroxylating dioxygenase subunit alpha [Acidimicrobiia bacterium]|nr:aromatic ring-hydroxylating dioxygenase subunit alpha [Acidimicrobiia bacterium]